MPSYFDNFLAINLDGYTPKNEYESFTLEEFKRFRSIAGTLLETFKNVSIRIDERIISHILLRSLLETYFWVLYIFDDPALSGGRYNELLNGFKIEYAKLYAEPSLPHKDKLEMPGAGWGALQKPKDIRSMLDALKNDYGDKLSYLYFVYRVTSFDTHGKSQKALCFSAFRKVCNFPYLKIERAIDLIANQYLVIWNQITK